MASAGTKLCLGLLSLLLCSAPIMSASGNYYSRTVPLKSAMREKTTRLHFFFHDTLGGSKPSSVLVAQAKGSSGLGAFGNVFAIDDPLTVGPEPTSAVIGNAQGLYVSSSQAGIGLVMYVDFGFTTGKFNGSSFTVMSRNPVLETERELAVVGGRGRFRLAKGFAQLKTRSINVNTGDAVVEYNVTLVHY